LEVPIGPSWTGRAWFPISLRELEVGVDFTQIRPPGLDVAVSVVDELLFQLDSKKLVLGGFSQGAMVATEIAMAQPESLAGLIVYSGVLLDEPGWKKKAVGLKGKPILQSHGMQDPVLPVAAAQKLHELLKGAGAEISFNGFSGQHEIPNQVLTSTRDFLNKLA
jgi:phospholipase/carboxylesterase